MEEISTPKPLVILASARKDSDTRKLVAHLFASTTVETLDLLDYKVYHYDYSGQYPADDAFPALVKALIAHPVIVFATPVYWYSMSAHLKVFFDRLTDLVTIQKRLGRQLQGKKLYLLAVGSEEQLPEGFEVPFRLTAQYFDMQFVASYYCATKKLAAIKDAAKEEFLTKFANNS